MSTANYNQVPFGTSIACRCDQATSAVLGDWLGLGDDQPGEKDTEECASIDAQRSFIFPSGGIAMDPAEQARFNQRLEAMMQAMHLHGLRDKTIDSYRRTLYRIAGHFGRCPDDLAPDELKEYFSSMLEQYSWSTIRVDLSSLQFFHRYVLEREMELIKIIRPPRVRTLPDIPTREEVQLLINTVRKLRYRIFLLVVYSLDLRITEGLSLEVADIDGTQCPTTIWLRGRAKQVDRS